MNTLDEPDNQIDPEDFDKQDLVIEGIVLPPSSPYRQVHSMVSPDSVHRMEFDLDGLSEDFPDLFQFRDPLSDNDW